MSMSKSARQYAAIHFCGINRVGIQDQAASFVADRGGNIIKNDVELLGAEAVVLFLVEGSTKQIDLMEYDLKRKDCFPEMDIFFKRTTHVVRGPDDKPRVVKKNSVQSRDFPGLLKRLTSLAVKHDLDIISHHGHQSALPGVAPQFDYFQDITFRMPPGSEKRDSSEDKRSFEADWLALTDELGIIE